MRASIRLQALLGLLMCLLLPWTALAQDRGDTPRRGGTYHRPLGNNPVTLDPNRAGDIYGRTVSNQIFDGLVQFDGSLAIRPAIADSWTASRDNLTWTFRLKKGVKFHNGREVTADDVVYTFTRIIDPETASPGATYFLKIKGAPEYVSHRTTRIEGLKVLDKYTIQIQLTESQVPFVQLLAIAWAKIVPREGIERLKDRFGIRPIGTGAFKIAEWIPNERIVLEANPEYFEGRPYLDHVEYQVFLGDDFVEMLRAFEQGHTEDSPLPAKERSRLLDDSRYRFIQRPILGLAFLGINTTKKPLDDPRIRQAINYAIDRRQIMRDIYKNQYIPCGGILPPGTNGYDPKMTGYPYDPLRASALLTSAGYPGGKGLPSVQIWSARKNEEAVAEHDTIVKYLAAVGIRAEVQYNTNWPQYKSEVYSGKLPVFRYSWYADAPDPDTFLGLFDSKGPDNLTAFRNDAVDALLRRARDEREMHRKLQLYQDIERQVMESAPVVALSYSTYERLFKPDVKGIQVSALGDPYIPMKKIWLGTAK